MKISELKEMLNRFDGEAEIMIERENDDIVFLSRIKDFGKTIIFK